MLASEYFTIASAYSSSSFTWVERAFQLLCLTLLGDLFFDVLLWLMLFTLLQTVTVGHSPLPTPYPSTQGLWNCSGRTISTRASHQKRGILCWVQSSVQIHSAIWFSDEDLPSNLQLPDACLLYHRVLN